MVINNITNKLFQLPNLRLLNQNNEARVVRNITVS